MFQRSRLPFSLLASALLAAPLSAGDRLLVAGYDGVVMEADTDDGVFDTFAPSCWCPIQAMAADRRRLYLAGDYGHVQVHDLETHALETVFWPELGPIHEIAAVAGTVFVGTSDGVVARFRHDGTPLGARQVPAAVLALLVHRRFLYVGTADGAIYRAPIAGGDGADGEFELFASSGLSEIRDMSAVGGELVIADASGAVARLSLQTGAITGGFGVDPTRSMTSLRSTLLFYYDEDGSGLITQRNAQTGEVLPGGFQATMWVEVMLVIPESQRLRPGLAARR
jgi:hypothetical protein